MKKSTTVESSNPVAAPEVLAFRDQFEERNPLDAIVRAGAQQMLQAAIDAEVAQFLEKHAGRCDEEGKRLVVRNGYHPKREVLTGAGSLEVSQPRVRDNSPDKQKRVTFTPSILPPYLRRSKTIDELIPWLYLKGISTGDFQEHCNHSLEKMPKASVPMSWCDSRRAGAASMTNGIAAASMTRSMSTSGRTAFMPTFGSRMKPINGSACWF